MHSTQTFLILSAFATAVFSRALPSQRAAVKYVTTTETIISTVTTTSSYVAGTTVKATGAQEIIPDVLTMTFSRVPAYVYLKTELVSTTVSTIYKTRTVKATASTSSSTTEPTTGTTSSSTPTGTTSSSTAIATKTSTPGCNVQGTAGPTFSSSIFSDPTQTADILACQSVCFSTTACQSYSYNISTQTCTRYTTGAEGLDDVVLGNTGTFFSQKYPGDGSNFCYGDKGY